VIDPSESAACLPLHDRTQAAAIFQKIIKHCDSYELSHSLGSDREYKRGKLLKLVYDYALSDSGRDNVLRYFLTAITTLPAENPSIERDFSHVLASLEDFEEKSTQEKDQLLKGVQELADHLIDGFFLPSELPMPRRSYTDTQ